MKSIEDSFQAIASKIHKNETIELTPDDHLRILQFYALWDLRHTNCQADDVELIGIHPGEELSQDSEEILESKHYIFAKNRENKCVVPGRFINGWNIQANIDRLTYAHKDLKWGIIRSLAGEFIVPDNFNRTTIVPISPKVILLGGSSDLFVEHSEVRKINRLAISSSDKYYFAQNFRKCPM